MAQFASNRSEFMTSDLGLNDIEYERKGGFFMTHKKIALVISAVVVIVIAAGFVGAYIGSNPKDKFYDTLELINGDVGCDQRVVSSKFSLSDAIRPSRYHIELSPIVEDEPISKLRGRVIIEFRYNGSGRLEEIVLNTKRIEVTRTKLVALVSETPDDLHKSRRRRRNPEEEKTVGGENPSEASSSASFANDTNELHSPSNSAFDTVSMGNVTDDLSANSTIPEDRTNHHHTVSTLLTNDTDATSFHDMKTAGSDDSSAKDFPQASETVSSVPATDKNERTEITINRRELDDEGGFIVLYPASPIEHGVYLLEIDYEVSLDGYNLLETNQSKISDGKALWAGQLNPTNIRNFFPLFDDVKMKARFTLTMPHPKSIIIHSNMPVRNSTTISDDWVLVTFEETPPISPNNLVVAKTKNLEILDSKTINETQVVIMGDKLSQGMAKYLIEMVGPVISSLIDLFAVELPIQQLNVIGIHQVDHNSGNLGLVMIEESLYKVNDESPEVTKERALMTLIKLIGQQWLGGLVNMHNTTDAWILESSLLYLQHYIIEEINAAFNRSTFLMDVQLEAMEVDGYSVSRSLQSKLNPTHSNSFYIHEVYAMGACLIRMLHGALSQPEIRAGYRSFVSRWSGGNADVDSFWEAIASNSTKDEQPKEEISLPEVIKLWTEESGYPVVTVTRNYETGSAVVHQTRFSYDKLSSTSEQLWHIPLTWISHNDTQDSSQVSFKWIKPQIETTLELVGKPYDNQSWIVVNPTKSGYFRVKYDHDNWNLLGRALRQNHEIFSSETRASLVDDVFSLAFVGLVPYSIAFDMIDYLPKNEMEPEPWTILLHHAVKLNLALYDSPVYLNYQEYMVKFLTDLYVKVGSKINEGTHLTRIVHQLACIFDYPDYLTWAKKSYAGFESSPGLPINNDVPSYLYKSLLCAFAKLEHELGWQWWQQKFLNVTNGEERIALLSSLACFQVPWMLQAVLNDIVYSTSFEESDALIILESFSNYPAASQTALKFVESNWRNITTRYPKSCKITSAFLDASSTGFTGEKDVEDFQSFRDKNYETLKKVGYVTAILEAKANACVSFLQTSLSEFHTSITNRTLV